MYIMYVVWTYIYEYLLKCVRPYNKEEMKDTYTNLTYVFLQMCTTYKTNSGNNHQFFGEIDFHINMYRTI